MPKRMEPPLKIFPSLIKGRIISQITSSKKGLFFFFSWRTNDKMMPNFSMGYIYHGCEIDIGTERQALQIWSLTSFDEFRGIGCIYTGGVFSSQRKKYPFSYTFSVNFFSFMHIFCHGNRFIFYFLSFFFSATKTLSLL